MALKKFLNEIHKLSRDTKIPKLADISNNELETYLSLLALGSSTASRLSEETEKARSTLQMNLKKLIELGLVSKTKKNNRTIYVAQHPKKLEMLPIQKRLELEAEIEEIKEGQDDVIRFIDKIVNNLPKVSGNPVLISYFEGEAGFKETCQRSITASTKEVLFLSNLSEWRKVYSVDYGKRFYVPERIKNNVYLRVLATQSERAKEMRDKDNESFRETRFLPPEYDPIQPTIIISDEEVSYMLSSEPYRAILIQDKSLADVWRITFDRLWRESK